MGHIDLCEWFRRWLWAFVIFIRSEAMTEVNWVKGNSRWPHGARKTVGSRMSSWGKLGNLNLAHDSHRNVATPRSGHECGTRSKGSGVWSRIVWIRGQNMGWFPVLENSHQSMKKGIHTHEKWIPNTGWLTLTIIYISVRSWFAPSTSGFLDFWWIQSPNTKDCATQHGATDVAWMS